jgi:hypothetical protein
MPERHTAAPATDQTIQGHREPEPGTQQEKKAWLDLSLFQVLGGALAAMTAAALGSRFGIEGTITGTALASVIAAVAGAVYTASLRRTSDTVRTAVVKRLTHSTGTDSRSTPAPPVPRGSTAVAPGPPPSPAGPADPSAKSNRRRTILVRSLVGAVATFALAAGGLTMYEAIAGQALSGGSGTTFSQAQQGGREDRPKEDEKAPAPSESAEPSSSAEPSESAEPSATDEAEPSATAEPSVQATEESSAEPSDTPDPEASTTAAQPSSAPSENAGTPR